MQWFYCSNYSLFSNSVHAEYQYNSTVVRVTEGIQALSNDMWISCSGSGEVMTSIRAYGKMSFYNGDRHNTSR